MGSFVFTAAVGTLLHFLFDWTGNNPAVGLFSAVNESVWEHLKLLFYPMLTAAVIQYFAWGNAIGCFWWIKLLGMVLGIVLIPGLYYTYTGILGINADWFNIAIFFIAAAAVYWAETKLLQGNLTCPANAKWAMALICLLSFLFTVFTFIPPHIPLFQDPTTGTYGYSV